MEPTLYDHGSSILNFEVTTLSTLTEHTASGKDSVPLKKLDIVLTIGLNIDGF